MKSWLNWTYANRAIGVFVILLGASTWPHIHGEIVISGVGFLGAPAFFSEKDRK
jgi:uncharacterized membrane protein YhiD involved in acid resistance